MNIIFTSKGKKEGISTDKVIEKFEGSDSLDDLKKIVEGAKDRISLTWASVEMKDLVGEIIPIDDIIKEQDTLLERNGPVSDEHTNRIIGETLAYKVMEHPKTHSMGVLHLDKTFDHNELDDKVWGEIQSGERTGASVGGFNTSESKVKDPVTGEPATALEGFHQFETASVFEPCNPEALTEAFSVVAKSKKGIGQVIKPAELDRCVQSLMDDPNFKPKDPNQTKEQAAFAVCQTQISKKSEVKKGQLADEIKSLPDELFDKLELDLKQVLRKQAGGGHRHTQEDPEGLHTHPELEKIKKIYDEEDDKNKGYINKVNNKKSKGDIMKISKIEDTLKVLLKEVGKLKKEEDENLEEEKQEEEENQDTPETKAKKSKQEEEEPEEKKKKKKDEVDIDTVDLKKEEARSDIDGEEPAADQPEAPEPDDVNDKDVFKQLNQVKKELKSLRSSMTPRPGGFKDVNKVNELANLPMQLVNKKKRMTHEALAFKVRDLSGGEV